MKKLSIILTLAAIGIAATNVGCGSSPSPGTGTGGDGGPAMGDPVPVTSTGFIDGSNAAGILGAWYSYGDWYGGTPTMAGNGDCFNMGGFTEAQCSSIVTPVPGAEFTNTDGKMCTSGTAAVVINMMYSAIWGTGIGFDLNNGGTDDGGTGAKLPWDAMAHGVTGLSFHIDMPPTGGQMRVEFPTSAVPGTTDINAAYWGGAGANLSPFTKTGTWSFHWTDVGGPSYLPSPMPFDKTKILSVQFHVVTGTSSPIPFNYCISDIRTLKD
jgi:hypothetical protein